MLRTYRTDSWPTLAAATRSTAGAEKIKSLRREAEAQKLDPNVWFNNVERVAAARVGQETVRYVRNIYKYYVAYKLIEEADAAKEAAITAAKARSAAAGADAPPAKPQ